MATGGRKSQLQVIHEISVQFGFGQTSGVIGVLPAGGVLNSCHAVVSQVWNGTTNTLNVGTTPGGTDLLGGDLKTLLRNDTPVPANLAGPYPTDKPIYGTITNTGPAPTQGVATVWARLPARPGLRRRTCPLDASTPLS